jgi:hypothetical protein
MDKVHPLIFFHLNLFSFIYLFFYNYLFIILKSLTIKLTYIIKNFHCPFWNSIYDLDKQLRNEFESTIGILDIPYHMP